MKLKNKIDELLKTKDRIFIALEGHCASGKSSLADEIAREYETSIFHTDDYFLSNEKKTVSRLSEPGGNVDYERMKTELFDNFDKEVVTYQKYNCMTSSLENKIIKRISKVNIIEGVYSTHPYFSFRYDLTVFLDVDKELQLKRLKSRNECLLKRFLDEWIPLEEKYFDYFKVKEKADIILSIGK